MKPATRSWLRSLDKLGDDARKLVADGVDPEVAITKMAHQSVEPREAYNFAVMCKELNIVPRLSGEGFHAEVECFCFARACLTKYVMVEAA